MTEKITFWRWLAKGRQIVSFTLVLGGWLVGIEVALATASAPVHWFAAGSILSFYAAFVVYEVIKSPEEYR